MAKNALDRGRVFRDLQGLRNGLLANPLRLSDETISYLDALEGKAIATCIRLWLKQGPTLSRGKNPGQRNMSSAEAALHYLSRKASCWEALQRQLQLLEFEKGGQLGLTIRHLAEGLAQCRAATQKLRLGSGPHLVANDEPTKWYFSATAKDGRTGLVMLERCGHSSASHILVATAGGDHALDECHFAEKVEHASYEMACLELERQGFEVAISNREFACGWWLSSVSESRRQRKSLPKSTFDAHREMFHDLPLGLDQLGDGQKPNRTALDNALASIRNGDYQEAESLLRRYVAIEPEDGLGWEHLGIVCLRRNAPDQAAVFLGRARRLMPQMARVFWNLAAWAQEVGDNAQMQNFLRAYQERKDELPGAELRQATAQVWLERSQAIQ